MNSKAENFQLTGYVLGVLEAAEFYSKTGNDPVIAQDLINELLDGKMKYVTIKRLAKMHKIELDWQSMDITVKRTD
ncbi:MAG: hypothetical protein GY790_10520 [Bacteroidetes bacterium]|nr:hypothetical protein [Bacteroidota bacterium]